MRRAATLLLVLLLMAITTTALAGWQNYKDKFESGGYNGNDGSLNWASSWREVGDNNDPGSGKVEVTGSGCSGQCLSIETGLLSGAGAYRLADTGEFANGTLSYDVAFKGGGLLGLLTGTLSVQATSNGGGPWTTVQTITLDTDDDDMEHRTVSVSGFLSDDFGVRFLVTGTLGAEVLIDNVQVGGDLIPPTTTTSTTTTSSTTTTTTTTTLPKLTTTTTLPKLTTTTLPSLTTTSLPFLTTTSVTTTTTVPTSTTSAPDDDASGITSTTTTIAAGAGAGNDDPGSGNDGDGDGSGDGSGTGETSEDGAATQRISGLLQPPVGLGADIPSDLFGSTAPEVLSFEIASGFSDAVELIQASWIWVLALALLIAGALVKGIDRRVSPVPFVSQPAE